jgi:hypothetical protein
MKKEELLKLADDKRFIPGVYNYCDRWCERCSLTSRCMNFAVSEEESQDSESLDLLNEAFWRRLSETFQATLGMIEDLAEREGIDLDSAGSVDEEGERLKDEMARSQKCCRMAQAYANMVRQWFDSVTEPSEDEDGVGQLNVAVLMPAGDPANSGAVFEDSLDVVHWYQHQIYVKLARAARSALSENDGPGDEFPKDSDGSAKVALIGIERSIAAWGELRPLFVACERELVHIILHLEGLLKEVERIFPAARGFVRPGFDEIHLNS